MDLFGIAFTVIIAHFLALLSPGPDFVLIVKSSIKNGNRRSIGVPAGIASANAVYIALCLAGVSSILSKSVTLLFFMKITGGLFLVYLSIGALKAKKDDYKHIVTFTPRNTRDATFCKDYFTGFASGILNPKNLLFYLSLFTVVLNKEVGLTFKIFLGIWMASIVFIWDSSIVFLLSTNRVRRKFSKFAYFIDKCTGVILGIIGISIVKSAVTEY